MKWFPFFSCCFYQTKEDNGYDTVVSDLSSLLAALENVILERTQNLPWILSSSQKVHLVEL